MADKLDSQWATEYLLAPLATQSAHWLTRRQSKGKMGLIVLSSHAHLCVGCAPARYANLRSHVCLPPLSYGCPWSCKGAAQRTGNVAAANGLSVYEMCIAPALPAGSIDRHYTAWSSMLPWAMGQTRTHHIDGSVSPIYRSHPEGFGNPIRKGQENPFAPQTERPTNAAGNMYFIPLRHYETI